MVHCRMSALGHVVGGAETVVRALLDTLGPEGTLMAYTGWQDEPPDDLDALDEEMRQAYLEEHPAYDPRVALSRRDHGRVAEALRTWPGSRHSGHPEAGVAAIGPLAEHAHRRASLRRRLRRGHALRPAGRARRSGGTTRRSAGIRDARASCGGCREGPRQAPRELRHARTPGRRARLADLLGYRHLGGCLTLRTPPRRGRLHRAHRAFRARGRCRQERTGRGGHRPPVRGVGVWSSTQSAGSSRTSRPGPRRTFEILDTRSVGA